MDKIKVSSQLVRIAQKSSKAYEENTPYQCLGPRTLIITLQFAREDIAAEPTTSSFHRNFPIFDPSPPTQERGLFRRNMEQLFLKTVQIIPLISSILLKCLPVYLTPAIWGPMGTKSDLSSLGRDSLMFAEWIYKWQINEKINVCGFW